MNELPELYPHQQDLRDRVRAAVLKHQRVILCGDTGIGKTTIAKWILGSSANRANVSNGSGRSLFAVHRRGLVDNAVDSFAKAPALRHGVIMSERDTAYGARIQVASIDSLLSWFVDAEKGYTTDITFDLIIYDEAHAHHSKLAKLLKYHDAKREQLGLHLAYVIGLTATPQARGLADVYREIVLGPPAQWLIANKHLSPFRYFSATQGKLEKLRMKGGEYTKESEAEAMDGLAGHLVKDWQRLAAGRPTVGFFPRRSHAMDALEQLRAAGLRVEYVDGDTPDEERRSTFWRLNNAELDYLCNVQVIERGTDIPQIGCVQLCVAIGSVVRYRQMIGRGSRRHPEKTDCLVIDHADNVRRHGLFEDDPHWTLDVTEKDAGEVGKRPTIECPRCCVARGTLILTERGEIPIQDVRATDLIWDGVEFCSHDGTCCNGTREVVDWCGITLTPDHEVLTHGGWKEAKEAKACGWRPVVGGIGGTPVRTTDNSNPHYSSESGKHRSGSRLQSLRKTWMASLSQDIASYSTRMRTLSGEVRTGVPGVAGTKGQSGETALSMRDSSRLQNVWRSRDRISLSISSRGRSMDCSEHRTSTGQIVDDRQNRQQWALRTWELAMGYGADAGQEPRCCMDEPFSRHLPIRDVLHNAPDESSQDRIESEGDSRQVDIQVWRSIYDTEVACQAETRLPVREIQQAAAYLHATKRHDSTADRGALEVEVWDIVNVGPRNRYTANGIIVANCAVYRGGTCSNCGYEPRPSERAAQGLTFDGRELKEITKAAETPKTKTPHDLMVQALFRAGRANRTWKQCVGIYMHMNEEQGTSHRIPRRVTIAGRQYEMVRFGAADGGRKVSDIYPITVGGGHGGRYLVAESQSVGEAW